MITTPPTAEPTPAPAPTTNPLLIPSLAAGIPKSASDVQKKIPVKRKQTARDLPAAAASAGDGSGRGIAGSWRALVWEKWRWGVFIAFAIVLSRIMTA